MMMRIGKVSRVRVWTALMFPALIGVVNCRRPWHDYQQLGNAVYPAHTTPEPGSDNPEDPEQPPHEDDPLLHHQQLHQEQFPKVPGNQSPVKTDPSPEIQRILPPKEIHAHKVFYQCKRPPALVLSSKKEFWELGLKSNWGELVNFLKPFSFGHFWVTDEVQERILDHLRAKLEESRLKGSQSLLHTLVHTNGGDNADLFKQVLALGVDPNQRTALNWTAAHIVSALGRLEAAKALGPCRPDLNIKSTNNHHTPLDAAHGDRIYPGDTSDDPITHARKNSRHQIYQLWESYKKNGFPHFGHLAYEKLWWAVQSLVRRRAIPEEELSEKVYGYTAVEWAERHDQPCIAAEIRYFFGLVESPKMVMVPEEEEVAAKFYEHPTPVPLATKAPVTPADDVPLQGLKIKAVPADPPQQMRPRSKNAVSGNNQHRPKAADDGWQPVPGYGPQSSGQGLITDQRGQQSPAIRGGIGQVLDQLHDMASALQEQWEHIEQNNQDYDAGGVPAGILQGLQQPGTIPQQNPLAAGVGGPAYNVMPGVAPQPVGSAGQQLVMQAAMPASGFVPVAQVQQGLVQGQQLPGPLQRGAVPAPPAAIIVPAMQPILAQNPPQQTFQQPMTGFLPPDQSNQQQDSSGGGQCGQPSGFISLSDEAQRMASPGVVFPMQNVNPAPGFPAEAAIQGVQPLQAAPPVAFHAAPPVPMSAIQHQQVQQAAPAAIQIQAAQPMQLQAAPAVPLQAVQGQVQAVQAFQSVPAGQAVAMFPPAMGLQQQAAPGNFIISG